MREDRRRESIEALALSLVGVVGLVLGARTFAPAPVVPAPAPVVVPPPGGWPAIPEHADEVVSYVLHAKLDPVAHTIDGRGTITLRNASSAPLSDLRLHLYLNAFEGERTIFKRARVGAFRGDRAGGAPGSIEVKRLALAGQDLWPKRVFVSHAGESPQDPERPKAHGEAEALLDRTDVRVPLPSPVEPGASITLEVEFVDRLPEVTERTGYDGSFHFAGQWFPKLARLEPDGTWASFPFHHLAEFYADYGKFDVTIDVPASYTIGASGPTSSSSVEGDRRVERHVLGDVHDFAWTAWDRFVVREAKLEGVDVKVLAPPGYEAAVERELLSVEHALRDKNARFGPYPYPVLTVVHPPAGADEAGGMEYPTLITTGGPWWPNHGTHEIEAVTIHELGHQWFYGLVGTHEVEWPAGDEGFNSFADDLALTRMFGPGGAVSLGPLRVDTIAITRRGAMPPFDEPIFQPAWRFATGRSYAARVYAATAAALETLRNIYGPERFDTAMGVWTRQYRFRHPTPGDFFRVLGEHVGPECAEAARTMLTTPFGYDVYVEAITSERKAKGSSEWASSAWIGRRGALDVPVDVELRFADGSRARRTIRFPRPAQPDAPAAKSEATATSTWYRVDADGPSALVAAIVDPDLALVIDRDRLDNFASTLAGRGGAPVTRERALAWLTVLVQGVGP